MFAKRSDMGVTVMKGLRFGDTQESCFEAWKRSNMGCATLLCRQFADVKELGFKAKKEVQICAVPKCKEFYCGFSRILFSGSEKFE